MAIAIRNMIMKQCRTGFWFWFFDLEADASTFAVIAWYIGTSWIMSHRALPIHELFMRAMSHSLMALDASSFWCFWRRRADECFEASQVNAKLRALQKWQLQHVPTLDSRNRSHCLLMLCIIHILIRRDWKEKWRTRGRVFARNLLFRSKEVRWGELFFAMVTGLDLLRHALMFYFSVLTLTCAMLP